MQNWIVAETRRGYGASVVVTEQGSRVVSQPLNLSISVVRRELLNSENASICVPENSFCIIHNIIGSLILKECGSPKVKILPALTFVLLKTGSYAYRLSKGSSAWIAISNYDSNIRSVLEPGMAGLNSMAHCRATARLREHAAQLPLWLLTPEPIPFFQLLEVLSALFSELATINGRTSLTPSVEHAPPGFRALCAAVQESPRADWTTQTGAEACGYSPHHFSRTFKQLTGVGFHDYVELVRLEVAISILEAEDCVMDDLAHLTGFRSSQALRDSLRDYLGIVASDVRALRQHSTSSFKAAGGQGNLE